ncbi:hypothetical protein H5P28_13510 [Ruficoccus amylovorans]|uniref:histidine kinase n=1 Tax=Ruficoccus amylovorans TaxID=1804625 RepID=A0A842HGH4_9BACT|nr:hypothetical protein [Ruficoccus amylovorans]
MIWGEYLSGGGTSYFPYRKLAEVKSEITSLEAELAKLPERHVRWMGERFGYHSAFSRPTQDDEVLGEWVELKFNRVTPVVALALAPAVNPESDRKESYGFPRRFRIEFRMKRGGDPVYVIDCTEEDFPDPGIAPVIFDGLDFDARFMKIYVDRGQITDGMEFFALSEIYVIEKREVGFDNIAPYSRRYNSRFFESYPYWDERFISDRNSSLGLPLGTEQKNNTDFIGEFAGYRDDNKVQIVFDLGREQTLGRATFYPAMPKTGMLLPHFGYPNEIYIEVFNDPELTRPLYRMDVVPDYKVRSYKDGISYRPVTDMFFAAPLEDARGRYVRITTSGLQSYEENSVLAFGEIILWGGDKNLSNGCRVAVQTSMQPMGPLHPERLVDGYVNSLKIINTYDWLKGLEKRNQLERELADKEQQLTRLENTMAKSWKALVTGILIVIALTVALVITSLKIAGIRSMRAVREQISRDLHDDVGCNIGTLSLGISNLQEELASSDYSHDIKDLYLVTQETAAALEEAVFFTNQGEILIADLAVRLEERARIILGDLMKVNFTVSGVLSKRPVDFIVRRHLFLFFKEALHNCAKHSHATQVDINLEMDGSKLSIRVSDNGQGFDMKSLKRISGLKNMATRASRVGGHLDVQSAPGQGTVLDFRLAIYSRREGRLK